MKELAMKVRIFRLDGKTEVKAAGGGNNRHIFKLSCKFLMQQCVIYTLTFGKPKRMRGAASGLTVLQ